VTEAKQTLKQRALREMRAYLVFSFYLFVVFSLCVVYKSVILAKHHIEYELHGFALINALALAKVMLLAQDLHFADQFRDAPLIYPTLLKSLAFTIVLAGFKIAEALAIGRLHGKSVQETVSEFGGGSWKGDLTLAALMFVMMIPFFGFTELRRVFGSNRLVSVFFSSRQSPNAPSAD
jgi:hypothetical protein